MYAHCDIKIIIWRFVQKKGTITGKYITFLFHLKLLVELVKTKKKNIIVSWPDDLCMLYLCGEKKAIRHISSVTSTITTIYSLRHLVKDIVNVNSLSAHYDNTVN